MKISIAFEALTGQFITDTDRLSKEGRKAAKDLEKQWNKTGQAIGAAVAAGMTVAVGMVKRSLDQMDQLGKDAQKIGMPVRELSALQVAADLAGVKVELLGKSVAALNRNAFAAAEGSKAQADAFRMLGIEVKDAEGNLRKSSDLLEDLADVFAILPDGAEKTAIAQRLLAEGGVELIPLLNQGSEAMREQAEMAAKLGKVIDEDAAKAAEQFNDNLSILWMAVEGLSNSVAADLAPSLAALTGQFVESITEGERLEGVADGIATVMRTVAAGFLAVAAGARVAGAAAAATIDGIGGAWEFAQAYGTGGIGLLSSERRDRMGAAVDRINNAAATFDSMFEDEVAGLAKQFESLFSAAEKAADGTEDAGKATAEQSDRVKDLQEQIRKLLAENNKANKTNADAIKLEKERAQALDRLNQMIVQQVAQLGGPMVQAATSYAAEMLDILETEDELRRVQALSASAQVALSTARAQAGAKYAQSLADINAAQQAARDATRLTIEQIEREITLMGLNGIEHQAVIDAYWAEEEARRQVDDMKRAGLLLLDEENERLRIQADLLETLGRRRAAAANQDLLQRGGGFGFINDAGSVVTANTFSDLIGEAFRTALDEASFEGLARTLGQGLRGGFTRREGETNAAFTERVGGNIAGILGAVNDAVQAYRNSDGNETGDTVRAIAGALVAVPVVGWIAAALLAIDSLAGGRLFGTSFEPHSTGRNVDVNSSGWDGNTWQLDTRQRSLFRGTARRMTERPLDDQTTQFMNDLVDNIIVSSARVFRLRGREMGELVAGSFAESFDRNGQLMSRQSTVGGQVYDETFQEFGQRLLAENLLAVDDRLSEIAERWRHQAGLLLEGTQLLLAADANLARGRELIASTLEDVVLVVEYYQDAGETLSDTYQRLTQTALSYGQAVAQVRAETMLQGLSEAQRAMVQIRSEELQRTRALEDAAYSLEGMATREQDLAAVREASQAAIDAMVAELTGQAEDLVFALFGAGAGVDAMEAELESLQVSASETAARLDAMRGGMRDYAGEVAQMQQALADGLLTSDFQRGVRGALREQATLESSLRRHAIAAGMAAAREEDLAGARELSARRIAELLAGLEKDAASQAEQLYGAAADASTALVGVVDGLRLVSTGVQEFLDGLTVDSRLSPLNARERLSEGERLLREAVSAGDIQQAQQLTSTLLSQGREFFASGDDYRQFFQRITGLFGQLPRMREDGGGSYSAGGYASAETLDRAGLARGLAQQVADIMSVTQESVDDVLARIGIPSAAAFASDLGLGGAADLDAFLRTLMADGLLQVPEALQDAQDRIASELEALVPEIAELDAQLEGARIAIEALTAALDAFRAQEEAADAEAERLFNAADLARVVADIASATGQTPELVAEGLGFALSDLGDILGIEDIAGFVGGMVANTGQLAQTMFTLAEDIAREMLNALREGLPEDVLNPPALPPEAPPPGEGTLPPPGDDIRPPDDRIIQSWEDAKSTASNTAETVDVLEQIRVLMQQQAALQAEQTELTRQLRDAQQVSGRSSLTVGV